MAECSRFGKRLSCRNEKVRKNRERPFRSGAKQVLYIIYLSIFTHLARYHWFSSAPPRSSVSSQLLLLRVLLASCLRNSFVSLLHYIDSIFSFLRRKYYSTSNCIISKFKAPIDLKETYHYQVRLFKLIVTYQASAQARSLGNTGLSSRYLRFLHFKIMVLRYSLIFFRIGLPIKDTTRNSFISPRIWIKKLAIYFLRSMLHDISKIYIASLYLISLSS